MNFGHNGRIIKLIMYGRCKVETLWVKALVLEKYSVLANLKGPKAD